MVSTTSVPFSQWRDAVPVEARVRIFLVAAAVRPYLACLHPGFLVDRDPARA